VNSIRGQYCPAQVAEYYDLWTDKYLEVYGNVLQGSRPSSEKQLLNYLASSIPIANGDLIIDAGCGVCGPAAWFAQMKNVQIEALTNSALQVAYSIDRIRAARLLDRVHVNLGDYHNLDSIYCWGAYDKVVFLESLAHATDLRRVFTGAYNVLKRQGILYIKDFFFCDWCRNTVKQAVQAEMRKDVSWTYRISLRALSDIVHELALIGFEIVNIRQPAYIFDPTAYLLFERNNGISWGHREDVPLFGTYEVICRKRIC
jgi:cyclopropane fatty-acyl-phospholipid synthase-like methyltransferase